MPTAVNQVRASYRRYQVLLGPQCTQSPMALDRGVAHYHARSVAMAAALIGAYLQSEILGLRLIMSPARSLKGNQTRVPPPSPHLP